MKFQRNNSHEQVVADLIENATKRWGTDRANDLKSNLSSLARDIWLLTTTFPKTEEEPGISTNE